MLLKYWSEPAMLSRILIQLAVTIGLPQKLMSLDSEVNLSWNENSLPKTRQKKQTMNDIDRYYKMQLYLPENTRSIR